jgi:hypothetical protein
MEELLALCADTIGVGLVPFDDLVEALGEAGYVDRSSIDEVDELRAEMEGDVRFRSLPGGWAFSPAALHGTVWTADVEVDERGPDTLILLGRLNVLASWLFDGSIELVDADGVRRGSLSLDSAWIDEIDTEFVDGPRGWLTPHDGAVATFAVDDLVLHLGRIDTASVPTTRQIAAVRSAFQTLRAHRSAADEADPLFSAVTFAEDVVLLALVTERDAFLGGPNPLQQELFAAAGLEQNGLVVAEAGFDWSAMDTERRRRITMLQYSMCAEQADAALLAGSVGRHHATRGLDVPGMPDDESALVVAGLLDDPTVAVAVLDVLRRSLAPDELRAFARDVARHVDSPFGPGLSALCALADDLTGQAVAAADRVDDALVRSPDFEPLLILAAGYACDRGDARTAVTLLRRAGAVDRFQELLSSRERLRLDPMAYLDDEGHLVGEALEWSMQRPSAQTNRNAPCPCGSGRKYKACHLGKELMPLAGRSAWLNHKARRFARLHAHDLIQEVAEALTPDGGDPFDLIGSDLVLDLVLHEGGVMAQFLASRSLLLPDDEAILGAQWVLTDRSLFETIDMRGDVVTLRDLRTGDRVTLTNVVTERLRGGLLLGRPLPVGDVYRAFGSVASIPEQLRTKVLEMLDADLDAVELAEAIADLSRPPTLFNTSGDPMVQHDLAWSITNPKAVRKTLIAVGLEPGDDRLVLLDGPADQPSSTVLASIWFEGRTMYGSANSDARAEMLRDLVSEAVPGARLTADVVIPAEEMIAAARSRPSSAAKAEVEPSDDETLGFMREYMRDYEEKWLDMAVPALGGRTPREAVTDPVGREQVEQLLAGFPPAPTDGTGMDAMRLRRLLGL